MPIRPAYYLTDTSKLVSQLRIRVQPRHRKLKHKTGPEGRLQKLSQIVTGLLKYERVELNFNKADEARGYAERLISEAIRHGDCHTPTMEMADYWIQEKQVIHKLFKVLAPRYQNTTLSYTKLYRAPKIYPQEPFPRSVLELRGNPFPPLVPDLSQNRNLIHNVLLEEAKKEYRSRKYAEMTEKLSSAELQLEKAEIEEVTNAQSASEASSTKLSSVELPAENLQNESENVAQSTTGMSSSADQGSEESSAQESSQSEESPEKTSKSSVLKEPPAEPKSS